MKKLTRILMMMLVLSVGTGITSCDEIEDMIDNPVVPEPTPTPTPQPEPQPEPQPQPEPEPIVSNLTEELNVASEEGAIVTVNFTMNDVNYEFSFKHEGNEFVLQNPETLPLMGWPTGLEPQLNLLSDDDDDADTGDDDTGDDDDDDDDDGDDDGDDSDVDYNYQPGDENIEYESDTTIEADFDGSDDDDDDTSSAGTRVATGVTKHYIMVFSIYETATQIDRYQAQWDSAEDSFADIHPFAMTRGSELELPVYTMVKINNLKVKDPRTSKIKTVTYSVNTTGKVVVIKRVTIKKGKSIEVDKSKKIAIKVSPRNATRKVKLTYNSKIVKITTLKATFFKYKGLKAGTNKIKLVFSNEKQNKIKYHRVTVKPNSVTSVTIRSPHLSNGKLTLTEGDTEQLTATVYPNGADKTVTWTTSNESVAKVSSEGLVTAQKAGTATIICHAKNNKTASCEVTVNAAEVPISSLKLSQTSLSLFVGGTTTLTAEVNSNATSKTVTWSVSEGTAVTVDQTGKVTAVAAGDATITAKAGEKTATCTVTVSKKAGSISFKESTVNVGNTASPFTNTLTNTGDGTVTYTISDNTCGATIDASTGKVTFTQAGSVTITATVADGTNYSYATKTATYTLSVSDTTDGSGGVPDNDDYTGGGNPF